MSIRFFVLILKCTEASTVPVASSDIPAVAGEDTNAYEKIHMYQINNDASFDELKKFNTDKSDKNENDKNHAIIFIKLTGDNISDYQEIKYFKYEDISNNFITQIDTATEMNCYQSTYAIKGITPETVETYENLKLDDKTNTKNILINNGGKIVVTSSQNNDQLILHYVSKMFGFEDIIKDLVGNSPVLGGGGGGDDDDVEGGETSEFTAEELAGYQKQMEQHQQGGKKKRSKQNTKKRNQK